MMAGCQVQHTTVLEQASSATVASNANPAPPVAPRPAPVRYSPCAAPAGTGPFERLSRPVASSSVPMPPKALAEHVDGCAGVRFRLGPDGAPRDIAVLAEYPLGYGFGATAYAAVAAARWPAKDDEAWRYIIINMHPHKPAQP